MHCIAELGAEQQADSESEGHPNTLVSTPEFSKLDRKWIMDGYPKTLVATIYLGKTTVDKEIHDILTDATNEIYEMGELDTPLYLKIG
jgi:hypothetical protein